MLNEEFVIVFEVGEGFCTQWNRYSNGRTFDTIRAIWISHAHWDHYGGLVNLLLCIFRARSTDNNNSDVQQTTSPSGSPINSQSSSNSRNRNTRDRKDGNDTTDKQWKRQRYNNDDRNTRTSTAPTATQFDGIPWLIAPRKVFTF
jgi:ribonuclease BN (tRNA processing enzyme)